jgi:phosphate-selective porin OprO and OprP
MPEPTTPPAAAVSLSREAQLEARVQQLEAMVNQLMTQQAAGSSPAAGGAGPGIVPGPGGPPTRAPGNLSQRGATGVGPGGTGGQTGGSRTGPGVPCQAFPPVPRIQPRFDSPAPLADLPAHVRFGPGFEIATDDEEFILQFHDLTQFDYTQELNSGANLYFNTFVIPRQWFMFAGHVTREIGYFVSIAQGINTLNGLDIFVDFNYDKRLQFRAGRCKAPFTYEFFVEPLQGLIAPEYSLFVNNFGPQRDEGIMAYGQLFDAPNGVSRIQYATVSSTATIMDLQPIKMVSSAHRS